jgi:hypothetical protein
VCERWKDSVIKGVSELPVLSQGELSPVYKERKSSTSGTKVDTAIGLDARPSRHEGSSHEHSNINTHLLTRDSSDIPPFVDPVGQLWHEEPSVATNSSGHAGALGQGLASLLQPVPSPSHPDTNRPSRSNSLQSISRDVSIGAGDAGPLVGIGSGADTDDNEDELVFFDCRSDSILDMNAITSGNAGIGASGVHFESQGVYDLESLQPFIQRSNSVVERGHSASDMSYRGLVISFVDISFLLLEFLYWQLHSFYQNDMRYLFDVKNTLIIFQRAVGSLLPGNHEKLLAVPDLYGPVLCVFCLPQVRICYAVLCYAMLMFMSMYRYNYKTTHDKCRLTLN